MGEMIPSKSEWAIMEVIWQSNGDMTAAEIITALNGKLDISAKTIRVMINRLVAKETISYTVDPQDNRIYHYSAMRSKEECLAVKSRRFVKNYFGGDASLAAVSFLKSADITKEQLEELKRMIDDMEKAK